MSQMGPFATGSPRAENRSMSEMPKSGTKIRPSASAAMGSLRVDGAAPQVIYARKVEPQIMRYELTDLNDETDAAEQAARSSACIA